MRRYLTKTPRIALSALAVIGIGISSAIAAPAAQAEQHSSSAGTHISPAQADQVTATSTQQFIGGPTGWLLAKQDAHGKMKQFEQANGVTCAITSEQAIAYGKPVEGFQKYTWIIDADCA
ncbi:hypothetical protein [Streptomyces sp. NPDC008121]|uniref:hypothetical protein n=1 Tax=Streptomyces sp. NPDC008121 TaxID=3364809 RepID=UPI0036E1BC4B